MHSVQVDKARKSGAPNLFGSWKKEAWPWVKTQIVPPVNIPIPTEMGSKMGGECTCQPKWDPMPQPHGAVRFRGCLGVGFKGDRANHASGSKRVGLDASQGTCVLLRRNTMECFPSGRVRCPGILLNGVRCGEASRGASRRLSFR